MGELKGWMTQGKHKVKMTPKDDWGMTARWCSSSWWYHYTTKHTRPLGRRGRKRTARSVEEKDLQRQSKDPSCALGWWYQCILDFPDGNPESEPFQTTGFCSSMYVQVYPSIHLPCYASVKTTMSAIHFNSSGKYLCFPFLSMIN